MKVDARNEEYEIIEIFYTIGLFTNSRLDRSTIPEGAFAYDLRHNDIGDFCTIEENVLVNHAGTIVTRVPIDLDGDGICGNKYHTIDGWEFNFIGESITLDEFMECPIDELETLLDECP